jgi:glutathione peroxidase
MKKITISLLLLFFAASGLMAQEKTLYDFEVQDISGESYDLSQHQGKKVLVVNTASKCGLTPQYEDLEKLYNEYKDNNFVILGFPANNFMGQEPGSNDEIAEFCQVNYGVTFPMMAKISVKGDDIHPLYKWLTEKTMTDVKWNFQKFMINEDGTIAGWANPKTKPYDSDIIDWLEGN